MNIQRRTFARILTFSLAAVAAVSVFAVKNHIRAENAERAVQTGYLRSVEELSLDLDNIKNNLHKGIYTNSVSMLSDLSGKLCTDASSAKNALSQLPMDELDLSDAYRFLSQVGNYSKSLADKCSSGGQLTAEDKANIAKLYAYSTDISEKMWSVEDRVEHGKISFSDVAYAASSLDADRPVTVTQGFQDLASCDAEYPTLIYDGPFSDHIMEKQPLMLKNEKEISRTEALRTAKKLVDGDELTLVSEEDGKMPSYVFSDGKMTVAVTKAGGYYSYMIGSRLPGTHQLTAAQAVTRAKDFLADLGIRNVDDSYYEIRNGVCVVNLAAVQNGVTMYTDLIKVGVALDNGEVLSFDMRGYLTNHTIRELPDVRISADRARSLISERLSVTGTKLCVIPTSGKNEVYCYELRCTGQDGENILVYVNALTGREEQILLLKIGTHGILTV